MVAATGFVTAYVLFSVISINGETVNQESVSVDSKDACDKARRIIVNEPGANHTDKVSTSTTTVDTRGGGRSTQQKAVYCFPKN